MKNIFYLLIFTLLLLQPLFGQQNVRINDNLERVHVMPKAQMEESKPGATFEIKFSADECYHVYAFASRVEVKKVNAMHQKMPQAVVSKIAVEADEFTVIDVVKLDEKIILLVDLKMARQHGLIAYEINRESCKLNIKAMQLFDNTEAMSENIKYEVVKRGFGLEHTEELVIQTIKTLKDDEFEIYLTSFDPSLKKVMDKKIISSVEKPGFMPEKMFFKDENNFIYTGITTPEGYRKKKKSGKADYVSHIFYFTNNGSVVHDFVIGLDGFFVSDMIAIIENDKIVVGGFYSNTGEFKLHGSFYQKIDLNKLSTEESVTYELNPLVVMKGDSNAGQSDLRADDTTHASLNKPLFNLTWISVSTNGDINLLAEIASRMSIIGVNKSYAMESAVFPVAVDKAYDYHFDELIVLKLSAKKAENRVSKIEIKQDNFFTDSKYIVFSMSNDALGVIFNGSLKEFEGQLDVNITGNTVPVIVKINADGKQQKEILKLPEVSKSVSFHHTPVFIFGKDELVFKLSDVSQTGYYRLKTDK